MSERKPSAPGAGSAVWSAVMERIRSSRVLGLLIFLLLICAAVTIVAPQFMSAGNLATLTRTSAFVALVSLGQMLVIIAGGIDLSVGSVAGFAGIVSAWAMGIVGIDPWVSVLLGILAGGIVGLINGILVTRYDLNAFVATLSVGFVLNGLILVFTEGSAIRGVADEVKWLGQGSIGPVPVPAIIAVLAGILIGLLLRKTRLGRHVFVVGGNEEAALLAGISVTGVRLAMFVTSGMLAATAGVLMMARLASGQPTIGSSWLLPSFAAPIIGGTSLNGGVGGPLGTIIGALIMGVLDNSIVMVKISNYWQQVVLGVALIIAIFIDHWRQQRVQRNSLAATVADLAGGGGTQSVAASDTEEIRTRTPTMRSDPGAR